MTLATGHMTPEREEETGLADCHAYAVLHVTEVEVSLIRSHENAGDSVTQLTIRFNFDSGSSSVSPQKSLESHAVEGEVFG